VKAGDTLPQGLIPSHEKFTLKADASCIEARKNTAALPKSRVDWRIFDPFL
jgi:hypothetical protein